MKRKRNPRKIKTPAPAATWLKAVHPPKGFSLTTTDLPEPAYRVFPGKNG